jgi:hypothetical protein
MERPVKLLVLLIVAILLVGSFPRTTIAAEQCSICGKIEQAKKDLAGITIRHSNKTIAYHEELVLFGTKVSVKDWSWKEIALVVMHPVTQETKIIKIRKTGIDFQSMDKGFAVSINPRLNGHVWNSFNTNYEIINSNDNTHWLVLANKYMPYKKSATVGGKEISTVIYTPFTDDLWASAYKEELLRAGDLYLRNTIKNAYAELESKNILSKAIPGKKLSEVVSPELIYTLILTEHIDPDEFSENEKKMAERVLIILGANTSSAFNLSTSSASARGIAQFIKGTYENDVRKNYKAAGLSSYLTGTRDHKESLKAAILLCDINLMKILAAFSSDAVSAIQPQMLAASYNGGVYRVIAAFTEFSGKWQEDNYERLREAKRKVTQIETKIKETKASKIVASEKKKQQGALARQLATAKKVQNAVSYARLRAETRLYLVKFNKMYQNKRILDNSTPSLSSLKP